jgi:hypothetical protein
VILLSFLVTPAPFVLIFMQSQRKFIALIALMALVLGLKEVHPQDAFTQFFGLQGTAPLPGLIFNPAFAADATLDNSAIGTKANPKYLLFYISGTSPEIPLGKPATAPTKAQTEDAVDHMIAAIGQGGDYLHTQLGFSVGPLMFDLTDAQLRTLIAESFAVAEEKNVAVAFHIDDSMFWNRRKDLWSDKNNVEWIDWRGTTVPHRLIGWVGNGAPVLAPPMCYNSSPIKAEATRIARDVIGVEIKRGIDRLNGLGKLHLFVGVMAGWETRMQDQFGSHGEHHYAIYCALHNLGYSAQNPPKDFDKALQGVVNDWIVLWARGLEAAGVPQENVYTHIAFLGDPSPIPPFSNQLGDYFKDSVPFETSFNKYSRPGFSIYGAGTFPGLYKVLARYPKTPWGIAEGTNVNLSNSFLGDAQATKYTMENYLGRAFNHGATFVNLYGAFSNAHDSPFSQVAEGPDAIAAYGKFLSGGRLEEETRESGSSTRSSFAAQPSASSGDLSSEVQRIQLNLVDWLNKHPDQRLTMQSLIPKLDAFLKAGNEKEAKKIADQILGLIGQ